MRLRWSDGQYSQHEPVTDIFQGRGFLECQLYHHKNAGRQKQAKRLLPAACVIPGFSVEDWATPMAGTSLQLGAEGWSRLTDHACTVGGRGVGVDAT